MNNPPTRLSDKILKTGKKSYYLITSGSRENMGRTIEAFLENELPDTPKTSRGLMLISALNKMSGSRESPPTPQSATLTSWETDHRS